jgi:hypothetical protein
LYEGGYEEDLLLRCGLPPLAALLVVLENKADLGQDRCAVTPFLVVFLDSQPKTVGSSVLATCWPSSASQSFFFVDISIFLVLLKILMAVVVGDFP